MNTRAYEKGPAARPVAGIVAEYNPFHNGHLWHIEATRRALPGAAVVCVMSGSVTQRGAFAVCAKHARAEMALRGGADLVLELPSAYACASAERFAGAGIALLAATGVVTHLSFGSEAGDLAPLMTAAETMDTPEYAALFGEELKKGVSHPTACHRAYERLTGVSAAFLRNPNNILGIEYLKALRRMGSSIGPITAPRKGAGHDAPEADGRFASASYLRTKLAGGYPIAAYVPADTQRIWGAEQAAGRAPLRADAWEDMMLSHLRRMTVEDFAAFPDVTEGLEERLATAARRARTVTEFYALAKTKRYTHARLRRIAMAAFLDLRAVKIPPTPPYLRVLAAGPVGFALLREMKKTATLPVVVKPAAARGLGGEVAALFAVDAGVTDHFSLGYPDPAQRAGGQEWITGPVIHP